MDFKLYKVKYWYLLSQAEGGGYSFFRCPSVRRPVHPFKCRDVRSSITLLWGQYLQDYSKYQHKMSDGIGAMTGSALHKQQTLFHARPNFEVIVIKVLNLFYTYQRYVCNTS